MTEIVISPHDPYTKLYRSLAREIAADIYPIEAVLKSHQLSPDEYAAILKSKMFQNILGEEMQYWNGTAGTAERVKLKMLTMVEGAAEEMWERLHDRRESLSAKVELYKTMMRGAGVGVTGTEGGNAADRITIQINMGADAKLTKEVSAPVIEGEIIER